MLSPELSTAAMYITFAISVVAFIAAYGCFHFCMQVAKKERDYRRLLLAITQLDDNYHALYESHKRLRSRFGMRELREKRKVESEPVEIETEVAPGETKDVDAWKKQKRAELATGTLKVR